MNALRLRSGAAAPVVIAFLVLSSYTHEIISKLYFYRALHKRYPFYVAESLDKVLILLICVAGVYLLYRCNPRRIVEELGLAAPVLPAIAFAVLASSPMLIGFGLTRSVTAELSFPKMFFLTVFSPFVEEVESRGFGFRQLRRAAGWPFWLAALPPAILFGLGHVEKGQSLLEKAGLFTLTGIGAVVFSWLIDRWKNLWGPFGLHFCMNLWWEVFRVGRTAIAGWLPFALAISVIVLAVLITLLAERRNLIHNRQ